MKKTKEELSGHFLKTMTQKRIIEIARDLSFVENEDFEEDEYKLGMFFGIVFGLEYSVNKLKGKHKGEDSVIPESKPSAAGR